MKQYCRYCGHACLQDDDLFYCSKREKLYNGAKAKRANRCKDFGYCGLDLFDPNKKYQPRQEKPCNGLQTSIFDEEEKTYANNSVPDDYSVDG